MAKKDPAVTALLDSLAELGGKLTAEEDIVSQGTKYVIPENADLKKAIAFFNEKVQEDQKNMSFSRTFNYRPWDGARATMRALKKAFGMVAQRGTPSFFGEDPPQLITIPVSHNETEQVPWGALGVIHLPGCVLYLGNAKHQEYGMVFSLVVEGPRMYRHHIEGVFRLIEHELEVDSLYRGKAFDGQDMPQFLDLSGVDPKQVIYSDEVRTQLEANVWSLLRYTDSMRQQKMPLKRAVLLEGPYGTGKTLAAYLTARIAIENGWTFVMCRPGRDKLETAMATARLYQPAVVFCEDVDTIATADRPDHVAKLLDIFDGIQAKGTEIICCLTTNHVEQIHRGMLRPGRLDSVISIGSLDAAGIQRMVEALVPTSQIDPDIRWAEVTDSMVGYLPAFCREAIDRTRRYNLARNGGVPTGLSTEDFVEAARGLRPQLELMEGSKDRRVTTELDGAMREMVEGSIQNLLQGASIVRGDSAWAELELAE